MQKQSLPIADIQSCADKDDILSNPTALPERQLYLYNLYNYIYFLGLLKQTTRFGDLKQ